MMSAPTGQYSSSAPNGTFVNGSSVPALPGGRVQRKTPGAFTRPGISISPNASERREWRATMACDLAVGDIVAGHGRVHSARETVAKRADGHLRWHIELVTGDDKPKAFSGNTMFMAYVRSASL